ncbi:hypothetical protein GCM10022234_22570 [Aeromicrobium panaciterrae]
MPSFCVNKDVQPNGDHEVHDLSADCPTYPSPENRLALGEHSSCHTAVQAAGDYYNQVNGCFHCARPCHTG